MILFIILRIIYMKRAILKATKSRFGNCKIRIAYTNGSVTSILSMEKTSNYRFSTNGTSTLQLTTGKIIMRLKMWLKKEMK